MADEIDTTQPVRVILGQTEIAGMPISAPVNPRGPRPDVRWVRHVDGTFELQALADGDYWAAVPFVD